MTKPGGTGRGALVGAWLLDRWDYTVEGEPRGYPMGEDAVGQIIYSPDGRMAAILSMATRPPLSADQFHKADPSERDMASLTYVSYGGTYEVAGAVVTHPVEVSLFPNWVGTDLVRHISWDGDRLVLTGDPEVYGSGRTVVNRLRWRRSEYTEQPQEG